MRIFIAGPYGDHNTKDIIACNVAIADRVARNFLAQGHQVYCPHKMAWGWECDHRLTRDVFLDLDRSFLKHWAEAIYRIPGISPGADAEIRYAEQLGLIILDVGSVTPPVAEKGEDDARSI